MSFGVDALSGLIEKLKQLINDTQNQYESFIGANQLYKQGKMNEREFFASIGDYLVATSAMNFLAVRVILEMKSKLDKGTSIKSPTGGMASPPSSQAGFGIEGFVNTGGNVSSASASTNTGKSGGTTVSTSYEPEPKLRPVDIDIKRDFSKQSGTTVGQRQENSDSIPGTKSCIVCGATIPKKAKFCSRCGNAQ